MKISLTIISIVFSLISPSFSTEKANRTALDKCPKPTEMTLQEKELHQKHINVVLKESRTLPLQERIAILRFMTKATLNQSKADQLCILEKYHSTTQPAEINQLEKELIESYRDVKKYLRGPCFKSDYSSDDPRKVFENPPFSLKTNKMMIEALSHIYYRGPLTGSLTVNYDDVPASYFPLKVFFLKPADLRTIMINDSFVEKRPLNLRSRASLLMDSVWLPLSWTYPKETYHEAVQYQPDQWYAPEVKWTNLMGDNLLYDDSYNPRAWNFTLHTMRPSYTIIYDAIDLYFWKPFCLYYGIDDESFDNEVDLMIANSQGNVFYKNYCFEEGSDRWHHNFSIALKPEYFHNPVNFYK